MNAQLPVSKVGGLVERFGGRYGVDPGKVMHTLKVTCWRAREGEAPPTNEEIMALMIVAEEYNLNPFLKEIYAFRNKSDGGIVPVIGVDGWNRISNDHPKYDGCEFRYSEKIVDIDPASGARLCPEWCEVVIYRNDRTRPTVIREYLDEVYVAPRKKGNSDYVHRGPWQTHTKRFLRHKAQIQGMRIAFGFSNVYDEDEARTVFDAPGGPIIDGEGQRVEGETTTETTTTGATSKLDQFATKANGETEGPVIDGTATTAEPTQEQPGETEGDAAMTEQKQEQKKRATKAKVAEAPASKADDDLGALFGKE